MPSCPFSRRRGSAISDRMGVVGRADSRPGPFPVPIASGFRGRFTPGGSSDKTCGRLSGRSLPAVLVALASTFGTPCGVDADDSPLLPGDVVLLDFGASWCGPCRQMQPVIGELARSGWLVRHVDVDGEPDLVRRFGITGVPCYVLLVRGEEKGRIGGVTTRAALEGLMARALPASNQPLAAANTSAAVPEVAIPGVPLAATPAPRPLVTERGPASPSATGESPGLPPTVSDPARIVKAGDAAASFASRQPRPGDPGAAPADGPMGRPADAETARSLLASSARLRVEDGKGASWGTGTVIDSRQGEALILTCGHIFRDTAGGGRVEVDLFGSPATRGLAGQVIAWNLERDLALVSVFTDEPLTPARVGPAERRLSAGESVFTVGCDGGADPTVQATRVTTIDKYLGPANVQVAGQPVQGRSGGGLFAADGTLIGVCHAADPADNEGLFAALPSIHEQLDDAGLGFVYRNTYPTAAVAPRGLDAGLPAMPPEMPAVAFGRRDRAEAVPTSSVAPPDQDRSSSAPPAGDPLAVAADRGVAAADHRESIAVGAAEDAGLTPGERALLDHVRRHGRAAEVICIVRPSDRPQASSEVFVLQHGLEGSAAGGAELSGSTAATPSR
jgi:thiol-disulfide isomerase/thioredoxin